MKPNPLSPTPPRHHHRLTDGERRLGRKGWRDAHLGVHTAAEDRLAAGYAYSAWRFAPDIDPDGWPVVVSLDTRRLTPEPDVDALLWWYERGGDVQVAEAVKMLEELDDPDDVWRVINRMQEGQAESGDHETPISPTSVLLNGTDANFSWSAVIGDNVVRASLYPASKGRHENIRRVLVAGFPQHRYLCDFDVDRVIEIRTFQPWYDRLAESYWEPEEVPSAFRRAEKNGWAIIDLDEADSFEPAWRSLYTGPAMETLSKNIAYHGTSSFNLEKAFPDFFKYGQLPPAGENYWGLK